MTINDTTGGSLPTATVTVTGLEPANRAVKITPRQTTTSGIVIFDALAPGRYAVVAEFTGFETSPPREVRVRAGDNRVTIVLGLARLEDAVIVGRDQQVAGSDRAATFGSMLTREQIDQLSDDPAIVRQQLEDLAGPGATHPHRQLRRWPAAEQVADPLDPHLPRSVRSGIALRRRHSHRDRDAARPGGHPRPGEDQFLHEQDGRQ